MNQGTTPVPGQAKSPPPLPFAIPAMTRICSETDDQALHLYNTTKTNMDKPKTQLIGTWQSIPMILRETKNTAG